VPKIAKLVVAVLLTVLALASMGLIWLKDSSKTPTYCNTCHIIQPYHQSWESSEYMAAVHANLGIPCQSCHARPVRQSVKEFVSYYVTHDYQDPLRESRIPKEECFRCHEDYPHLAELTENPEMNPHDSHLGEVECRLCHKAHKPSELYCAQCHEFAIPAGWIVPTP